MQWVWTGTVHWSKTQHISRVRSKATWKTQRISKFFQKQNRWGYCEETQKFSKDASPLTKKLLKQISEQAHLGRNFSCAVKFDFAWMYPVLGSSSKCPRSSFGTSKLRRNAVFALIMNTGTLRFEEWRSRVNSLYREQAYKCSGSTRMAIRPK